MPVWQAERSTVSQRLQIGPEISTAVGTPVAAGKLLESFDWVFGINGDAVFYRPTGFKYPTEQAWNTEWVDGTFSGALDFNGLIYPLASAMGSVAPVAHGTSITAKDWIFSPPSTGSILPQTYTMMQGDSTRAHKISYGLFTEFGYTGTRKSMTCSGKFLGQPLQDGITMTAAPTAVPLAPVVSKEFNVYLDLTSAGLGTTQLTRVLSITYMMSNIYTPLWVFNRSTVGFTAHVDAVPTASLRLKTEADAASMALLSYLQAGTKVYVRIDAQGNAIDVPNTINSEFKHDMCCILNKPASVFGDDQGVYSIEWALDVVHDPTWLTGQAQTLTVTNLVTTL